MAEKKTEEPRVAQPTAAQQREYESLVSNTPTEVSILRTNKKYRIKWIKNGAIEKLSRLLIHAGDTDNDADKDVNVYDAISGDAKLACKAAALFILNGYWSIRFKYWFLWRWFYYVRQYDGVQLQPVLAVGKKKTSADGVLRDYHIADRGQGYTDADEDEGSRTYPSRTSFGSIYEQCKHREYLVRTRYFLFGLIAVPRWEYNWVYTKAQLQLMAYDTTVTLYKAREKKHDSGGAYHKPDKAKMHDAYVKWKLRRAKRKFDIKKFLGGASKDNDNGKGKESQHVSEG